MAELKRKTVRSVRKARHGWFDYEVLDIFGDALGPYGLTVYMVLARFCYGGTRVCMSLREMAQHCRMGKTKVSDRVEKLVELGLIVEHKGKTERSPSCFDLLDVKDLLEEIKGRGGSIPGSGSGSASTVPVADSEEDEAAEGAQQAPEGYARLNRRVIAGDAPMRLQSTKAGTVDLQASALAEVPCVDCPPDGQMRADDEERGVEGATGSPRGQMWAPTRTDLSATDFPLITKKEETRKEQDPPTPASGGAAGSDLPFADVAQDDVRFADEARIAASWAMGACELGLNSRRKRVVADAFGRRAKRTGETLHAVARLAVENFQRYHQALAAGELRFGPWAPMTFFDGGYWENDSRWPWDQAKRAAREAAAVGMRRPSAKPAAELDVAGYIAKNAELVEKSGVDDRFARELRELAAKVQRGDSITELDEQLQAIEDAIVAELRANALNYELGALEAKADVELARYRGTMTAAVLAETRQKYVERELLKAHQVPRLGLFYLH